MMNKKFILIVVLFVATASSVAFSPLTPSIGHFTEAAAMGLIFSEYNEEHRGTLIPMQLTSQWDLANAQTLITPILTGMYEEDGQMKAVVVTARQKVHDGKLASGSINAGTPISVYVFVRKGERWFLETEKENVIDLGNNGNPPSYKKLVRIGTNKHGVQFDTWNDSWLGHGRSVTSFGQVIIGISDGAIAPLADFLTDENNSMSCAKDTESQGETEKDECWSYEGKLTFLRREGEDYYLAKISYKGSEPGPNGGVRNVDRDDYYVKGESRFQQVAEGDLRVFGKGRDEIEPVSEAELNVAPLPISTTTGPSTDCGDARDTVEIYICRSNESSLKKLDRDLGMKYQSLMQTLPPAEAAWLAQSHYNWLESRSKCKSVTHCLEQAYRSRLDEFALHVVENPIEKEKLPYRFVTPGGLSGELAVESGEGMRGLTKQSLVYRSGRGEQTLWGNEQNSYAESTSLGYQKLKGVSLIALQGSRLILVVNVDASEGTGESSVERRYYYAFNEGNGFVLQGVKDDEKTDSSETGHMITTRWVKGDESPLLESTERYWDETGDSSKLLAKTRLYRFSFDDRPWREEASTAQGKSPENAGDTTPLMASVLNKETAMLGIFGAFNSDKQGTLIPTQLTSPWDVEHAETLAKPIFVKAYEESGQQKGIILVQRQRLLGGNASPSVADLPSVSMYTFKRTGDLWLLDEKNVELGQLGFDGLNSVYGELVELGKDKHGIVLNWTHGAGKSVARHATVIGLGDGASTVLGSYIIDDNNAASCSDAPAEQKINGSDECWGYKGELSFAKETGKDYYVLKLSYDGTALVDGIVQPKNEPLYYRKGVHGYERISSEQGAAAVLQSELGGDEALGFGFDCAQPFGELEKRVCQADKDQLRKLSQELADKYKGLQKTLTDEQSRWLRDNQRQWAAGLPGDWKYQDRIKNLALGMAVMTKDRVFEDFSYQVTLPNGLDGTFQYVQKSSLRFIGMDGRRLSVWDAKVPPDDLPDNAKFAHQSLEEFSIIVLRADQVALVLKTSTYADGMEAREYHHFFAFDGNRFVQQGVIATSGPQYEEWVAGDDGPWLQVTSYSDNPFWILDPTMKRLLYRLRFDGQPWQEVLPPHRRWLNEPGGAARYHALYDEIVAEIEPAEIGDDMCTESGIRWTLANASLADWLDLVLRARERGVHYGDAPAIIAQVLSAGERPALTDQQRELFLALDYVRRQQEATDGWWSRLDEIAAEADTSSVDFELIERHGIAQIANDCMNSGMYYDELSPDLWYNTFWIRRYLDGTYNVAKQVIAYALDQAPEERDETTHETSKETGEQRVEETDRGWKAR